MNKLDNERYFAGYTVRGCAVRSRNIFYFVAQEDYERSDRWEHLDLGEAPGDDELEYYVVSYMRDKPAEKQWSKSVLQGFPGILGAVTAVPAEQFVVSCSVSHVYAIGSGAAGIEADIPRGATMRLRTIGDHVYAAGSGRNLHRREAAGMWTDLTRGMSGVKRRSHWFNDVAGFNERELYAVGGDDGVGGDVWMFDGSSWRQCAFPLALSLRTVCCGEDGNVYVSDLHGTIFVGRGDTWKLIRQGDFTPTLSVQDMVWYEDRVWCTAGIQGLWWIEDGRLTKASVPINVSGCSEYLAARDGVLLVYGYGVAAFRESGHWNVLF